jgi:secondary thiamine-phosphate synthase enzyme
MQKQIEVRTSTAHEFVDITNEVAQRVAASSIRSGMCFVFCPHTTAGLTINENADPGVKSDMLAVLDSLVPVDDPEYRHAEGNSAAHVKAGMMGFSVMVPVSEGRLALGTWQGIYLCEFDGPRSRRVHIVVSSSMG